MITKINWDRLLQGISSSIQMCEMNSCVIVATAPFNTSLDTD